MSYVRVELGERSYPIHIGSGLLRQAGLLAPYLVDRRVLVVTNESLAPLYLEQALAILQEGSPQVLILPDGEEYKTLQVAAQIFDALLKSRFGRDSVLVALGGGVIGDITGFAAACYQRGVPYVQIPTTLLAQVDSSVGGKTGVNHPLGKNMIGAFHQPICVVADTDTLSTLKDREFRSGLAEIIKYGLIRDANFFLWLEDSLAALLERNSEALAYAIRRSCEVKADVVGTDEREIGERVLLNLGHTFGHAIETGLGYGQWLHGEAVGAGICIAGHLSARLGRLSDSDSIRIDSLVARAGLPVKLPAELKEQQMLELMSVDKKARRGCMQLVLLNSIGSAALTDDFSTEALMNVLHSSRLAK
ncbi:MAG: 3-dehydroquinate synthase [Gammaproteobacteria bacterium]